MSSLEDNFLAQGGRALRRATISTSLEEGKTPTEIKAIVKNSETRQRELLKKFTENLINPDSQFMQLTEYFYTHLKDEFPEIVACGLAGSNAFGGSQIRKETGQESYYDFDAYLVLAQESDSDRLEDIQSKADDLLADLIKQNDPLVKDLSPYFHFCNKLNYQNTAIIDLRSFTDQEIKAYLQNHLVRVVSYFTPTYPPEVGQGNRERLLFYLGSLPQNEWDKEAEFFKRSWLVVTPIRDKHLFDIFPTSDRSDASQKRDDKLAITVEQLSKDVSRQLFNDLIDSTKPQK